MIGSKKVVVVMPAFNAARTLERTCEETLATGVVDLIVVVDDASGDETMTVAAGLHGVVAHAHAENRGYGANQKTCYRLALEHGADIVVMVHPDYQYTPKLIPAMASMIASGLYACVIGSRILGGQALDGGMPIWRYVSNRALTLAGNTLLGTKVSEFHTGYRAFSRELLKALPLDVNSDDFVFDHEILAQTAWIGLPIGEVSCPTSYTPESSSINFRRSVAYGFGCLATDIKFRLAAWSLMRSSLFSIPRWSMAPTSRNKKTSPASTPAAETAPASSAALSVWTTTLMVAALLALTAWAYAPVRTFSFVTWDDVSELVGNTNITRGVSLHGMWWALTYTYANWLPLTSLSHMLDWSLFGMNAGGHHMTSLLIHLLNTALLFVALKRLTGSTTRSWWVAALFAVHPLHVESVAWISERKDVLSTCFVILTLWAYAAYAKTANRRLYVLALGMFALGAMAKPMVVTVPLLLLLLDAWPLQRAQAWRERIVEKLPFAAIAAGVSGLAIFTQRKAGAVARLDIYPLPLRLSNAVLSYAKYIGKMFWPADLAAYYPLPPHIVPPLAETSAALLGLLSITAFAVSQSRRRPYIISGWLWFVVMLLPVIGIVQVGDQAMADRYTYLPMVGLFIIAAWGGADIVEHLRWPRPLTLTAAAAVVIACAATTRVQTGYWKDSDALWARSLAVAPDFNFRAHAGLGDARAASGHLDAAIAEYTEALRILPGSAEVHNDLGNAFEKTNNIADAAAQYRTAISLDATNAEPLNNLGAILARQGQIVDEIDDYQRALRLAPAFGLAEYNLGLALAAEGRVDEGIEHCRAALRDDSSHADWHNGTARLLAMAGRKTEAIEQLQAALVVDPSNAAARQVLTALASNFRH